MKKVSVGRVVLTIVLVFVVIVSMLGAIKSPKRVRKQSTIDWLEATDENTYADVKAEIKAIIEAETGEKPVKVAFKVGGGNYQTCTYDLDIWYKTEDGNWYWTAISWWDSRIPNDLDERLMEIYRS